MSLIPAFLFILWIIRPSGIGDNTGCQNVKKKDILANIRKRMGLLCSFVSRLWNRWLHFKKKKPKLFSQLKRIVLSLGLSLILLLCCYFSENHRWFISLVGINPIDSSIFNKYEWAYKNLLHKDFTPDDVFFVDVSSDYMLVKPENNSEMQYAIPDREKMLDFLKKMQDGYDKRDMKHGPIFIDIDLYPEDQPSEVIRGNFVPILKTKFDSDLADQIVKMKNVFISRKKQTDTFKTSPLGDKRLDPISLNCAFPWRKSSGSFEKYSFMWDTIQTIAMKLYELETGRIIDRKGPFYFDSGLCTISKFLIIHDSVRMSDVTVRLGDIFKNYSDDVLRAKTKGKIVIIGSLDGSRDDHSTYMGTKYGPYLHYLGYRALKDGKHIVGWRYVLSMLFLYTLIHYYFFCGVKERLNKKFVKKKPVLYFVFSLFGVGFCLLLIDFVLYLCDIYHPILIPFIWLTIVNGIVKTLSLKKKKQ